MKKKEQKTEKAPKKVIFEKALKLTWFQFSSTSTIHGVRHINDLKANNMTKTFWIIMVLLCFSLACALVATFIIRYKSNPVRLNIQTSHESVGELTFPAVIFCNANFLTNRQVQKMVETLEIPRPTTENPSLDNLTDFYTPPKKTEPVQIERLIGLVSGFVEKMSTINVTKDLQVLQAIMMHNRYNIDTAMQKLMYPCTDLIQKCRFAGEIVDCRKIFQPTETTNGYCCGFNIIPDTKSTTKHKATKPLKNPLFGVEYGLSVVLRPLLEEGAVATVDSEGVKMFVNDYDLYPYEVSILKMLPHRMETLVELKVEQTINSKAVQTLPISDRGCYFEDEYNLRFFKKYTAANCDVENRMDTSNSLCECIPYYYYKVEGFDVCNFTKIECLVDNFEKLKILTNDQNITEPVNKCLPQCEFVTLSTHITSVPINANITDTFNDEEFYSDVTSDEMVAHIFWKSQTYRVYRRDLLTNIITLISNLGGVYALLVGMSILSVFEVLYYFTVRLYLNYKDFQTEDLKAKTFSKRLEVFDNMRIPVEKIPRLDTARSSAHTTGHHGFHF